MTTPTPDELRPQGPLNELAEAVHRTSAEHGFWEGEHRNIPSKIALIHSEVSEALEDYRKTDSAVLHVVRWVVDEDGRDKPDGFPIEIADAIIRLLDLAAFVWVDVDEAIRLKAEYNRGRPHLHGGKRA
jgi:hypothetical protein